MKKVLSLAIIVTLFATACGNNGPKVVCTSNATSNGMTIEQEYILNYAGEGISNVEVNKSYAFEDNDKFTSFKTVIDNTVSNMKEIENDYIKFESNTRGKKYSTTLTVDMNKATDEELTTLGLNKNLEEFKTTLEGQGLTCK